MTFQPRAFLAILALFGPLFALPDSHAQRNGARTGEVTRSGEIWTANVDDSPVYAGGDMIEAIQAAIDHLTPDRTAKETVNVRDSGSTGIHIWDGDIKAVNLRSYTVLDFHGNTMHVDDNEDNTIVPVRGRGADHIEVRNMRITGNPRYGMWFFGCENVVLSENHLSMADGKDANGPGLGVRFEAFNGQTSGRWNRNVEIDHIFVEDSKGHAVEFWGTDGLTIGTVETRNSGGAGLLINNNRNVHVGLVDAYRANYGGGYAGFRTANNAGPNIVVDKVIAVECGRGVFTVSGSHGVTVHEVAISGSTSQGILIEDTQDTVINGGTVSSNGPEGVRITSRSSTQHRETTNVTVRNLRVSGASYGIRETLPRTHENRIFNNDLRGNDTCLVYQGDGTLAAFNTCVRVPENDLYPAWLDRAFPDLSEDEASPGNDPFDEGFPNLLRYALGPRDEPALAERPVSEIHDGRVSIRFLRDSIKEDIAYVVEASSDLASWDEVLYDSRIHQQSNNEGAYMRVVDSVPAQEGGKSRFLRLRVELEE